MKNFNDKTKYEGQALAITMVVLVVSALIGLSIYSRSMKDRMLTLEERASAEALEISEVTLDRLTTIPIEDVIFQMEAEGGSVEEGITFTEREESGNELTQLFRNLGIIEDTATIGDLLSPLCPIGTGGNEYELTLKTPDENTFYEVRAGHVWSLPAKELLKNSEDDCFLDMNFAIRGDSRAGFIVTKLYCDYDANGIATRCDKYEVGEGHVDKYCFSDGLKCNNSNFLDDDNWEKFNPDEDSALQMSGSADDVPSEIRITAVGGTIGINYGFNNNEGCMNELHMYQLRATANCSGVYRGKEILIPEKKWHESIFDYVIFNAEGSI